MFEEGSSLRASNVDLIEQAILASGIPQLRDQVEPDSDTALLLDVLRAELAVENEAYLNFIKLVNAAAMAAMAAAHDQCCADRMGACAAAANRRSEGQI